MEYLWEKQVVHARLENKYGANKVMINRIAQRTQPIIDKATLIMTEHKEIFRHPKEGFFFFFFSLCSFF